MIPRKLDPTPAPISTAVGVLGMLGLTAYSGTYIQCEPQPGETLVVSAASGGVGQSVGQIARILGCRVVWIAGIQAKCDFVTGELGLDDCVSHLSPSFPADLAAACPNGIDIYFENVGGKVFEAVAPLLNDDSRISQCGMVSQYGNTDGRDGRADWPDAGARSALLGPARDGLAGGPKCALPVGELRESGAEVRFWNGNFGGTPEGDLQLQVVGMFPQYEKAKIAERTRRGKLYWARQGFLPAYMVPLGFEFVPRHDSNRATLTIHEERAAIVRDIFRWCADECATTRGIAKRLMDLGIPTARGGAHWYPTTIRQMLRNPAYKGEFTYRRTERIKGHASKKKTRSRPRPREDWIVIPVPALVDEATWDRVQTQWVQHAAFSTRHRNRH